ncbi:MAG: fatty acid desaturase [Myxococcaceae bacterium]|jgi:omega-6 fatty acid desaturase (delta-12 desaturase)|nr:fatty acid desaturase [Myxococcaceae bacterium]
MTTATVMDPEAPQPVPMPALPTPAHQGQVRATTPDGRRAEKEILLHSREFTAEDVTRSWAYTLSTFLILGALSAAAVALPTWWLRLPVSVLAGLTAVRTFCLFHDYQHGAILRQSKVAEALFFVFGMFIMTPPSVWRETHNYHHQHNAKLIGSHIGSYPMLTPSMYAALSPAQKLMYRFIRSPLNMLLAIFTVFGVGMNLSPFLRAPKKHWAGLLCLVTVIGLGVGLGLAGHFDAYVFGWFIPMAVAAASGSYLFYAQHNFPGMNVADRSTWTFSGAAIDSSSFMKMGPFMNWMTANIGYHHVHHLNATIPFYRLPEAMEAIPELRHPGETSWHPKDMATALKLKLWDPEKQQLVGFER